MEYEGDFLEDAIVDIKIATNSAAGAKITLAGTPAVSVYKDNGTTEITAGVTLTVDFDGRTGFHHIRVDMSASASYTPGSDYWAVITTGTVDSVSVVGDPVAHWSCENRYVDVARIDAVDVQADSGAMRVSVGTAAGQLDLSAGVIKSDVSKWNGTAVATPDTAGYPKVTGKIGTGAGEWNLSGGNVAQVNLFGSAAVDQIEAAMLTEMQTYKLDKLISAAVGALDVADNSIIARLVSKSATAAWGSYSHLTDSLEAQRDALAVTDATAETIDATVNIILDRVDTSGVVIGGGSVALIADAVWDEAQAGHTTAGTFGRYVDAQAALIKAKTDNLPASPAAVGSAMTLTATYDLYHAEIDLRIDAANSRDEYTITWFKNGARVTSGITVPTLQVVKRADGADLIASTTPTQIGATGSYKHDATTSARTTAGEACLAIVTATIDGSTRSFSRLLGRDSTA